MMVEMSRWIKENGLLIANLAHFAAFFVGMIICGVPLYKRRSGVSTESRPAS
jgi:hypothetical protein